MSFDVLSQAERRRLTSVALIAGPVAFLAGIAVLPAVKNDSPRAMVAAFGPHPTRVTSASHCRAGALGPFPMDCTVPSCGAAGG